MEEECKNSRVEAGSLVVTSGAIGKGDNPIFLTQEEPVWLPSNSSVAFHERRGFVPSVSSFGTSEKGLLPLA